MSCALSVLLVNTPAAMAAAASLAALTGSAFDRWMASRSRSELATTKTLDGEAPGDLVVTADIPLAADVVAKGAEAIDPRGGLYTEANIGERLVLRNMLDQLRGGGHIGGGPPNFGPKDRQAFANQLDRWLVKHK